MEARVEVAPGDDPDHAGDLDELEAEAISIFWEIAGECDRPVLLFSGGKDSAVLLFLAAKAFAPAPIPFPVLHVDTGHNFPEVIAYRDLLVEQLGLDLVVGSVQDAIDDGRVVEEHGPRASRNRLQTRVLLDTLVEHRFDVAFGGGRRDEDKARAKERILSHPRPLRAVGPEEPAARAVGGAQPPPAPRRTPARVPDQQLDRGRHLALHRPRADPAAVDLLRPRPGRDRARRHAAAVEGPVVPEPGEVPFSERGALSHRRRHELHGRVRSDAPRSSQVIEEVLAARITERGATRADDTVSEAAMEDRKREGYF